MSVWVYRGILGVFWVCLGRLGFVGVCWGNFVYAWYSLVLGVSLACVFGHLRLCWAMLLNQHVWVHFSRNALFLFTHTHKNSQATKKGI